MNLVEHKGKELFASYGIEIPKGSLVSPGEGPPLPFPFVLKSQVPFSDRKKEGGIAFVQSAEEFVRERDRMFASSIKGRLPEVLLAEEMIQGAEELYASLSYDTDYRAPVLCLSRQGGSGIQEARVIPLNLSVASWGSVKTARSLPDFLVREALSSADLPQSRALAALVQSLWLLFVEEQALTAEINPIFLCADGRVIAGDAKVVLDDNAADPDFRPFLELGGDIAVLASGGGASLVNLDALLYHGGKPANYVEYSGNPPASVVRDLTQKVMGRPGLRGCWVVGGTANFTDIFETMSGFVQGLREVVPKPSYPIVIRRDGPRQEEAFVMLREVAEKEGYDFHLYGPEISMSESAKIMVEKAYS